MWLVGQVILEHFLERTRRAIFKSRVHWFPSIAITTDHKLVGPRQAKGGGPSLISQFEF